MAREGFWPLYEGKHIEQFLTDIKPVERWVDTARAEKKNGRPPDPAPKLVFRDIARNTDERTCIAAVLPERSCVNHKLPGIICSKPHLLAAILNSFSFDFGVRLRSASTSLTFSQMSRCPLPSADEISIDTLATRSVIGRKEDNITELSECWPSLWEANRAVAAAYGLTAEEFEHILASFPVFAHKRPAFLAYLQTRIGEWEGGGTK